MTLKSAVLRTYELVPETCRQKFRNSRKNDYIEIAQSKETLFDCWCVPKDIQKDFGRLRQSVLMEEFKNCLPSETYLEEQKIDNLHQAATHADNYALTHNSYGKIPIHTDSSSDTNTTSNGNTNCSGHSAGPGKTNGRGTLLLGGPTYCYCR